MGIYGKIFDSEAERVKFEESMEFIRFVNRMGLSDKLNCGTFGHYTDFLDQIKDACDNIEKK